MSYVVARMGFEPVILVGGTGPNIRMIADPGLERRRGVRPEASRQPLAVTTGNDSFKDEARMRLSGHRILRIPLELEG